MRYSSPCSGSGNRRLPPRKLLSIRHPFLLIFLCSLLPLPTSAQNTPTRGELVLRVFGKTCMKYVGKPAALRAAVSKGQELALLQLPPPSAKAFLGPHAGEVWLLPSMVGSAVLVMRSDGVCSIFVRKWTEKNFVSALKNFFHRKIPIFSLEDNSHSEGAISSQNFKLRPTGKYKELLDSKNMSSEPILALTVSTSKIPNAKFQLALTLARLR